MKDLKGDEKRKSTNTFTEGSKNYVKVLLGVGIRLQTRLKVITKAKVGQTQIKGEQNAPSSIPKENGSMEENFGATGIKVKL